MVALLLFVVTSATPPPTLFEFLNMPWGESYASFQRRVPEALTGSIEPSRNLAMPSVKLGGLVLMRGISFREGRLSSMTVSIPCTQWPKKAGDLDCLEATKAFIKLLSVERTSADGGSECEQRWDVGGAEVLLISKDAAVFEVKPILSPDWRLYSHPPMVRPECF